MKKIMAVLAMAALIFTAVPSQAFAVNTATHGKITGKTVVSALCRSLFGRGSDNISMTMKPKRIGRTPSSAFFRLSVFGQVGTV